MPLRKELRRKNGPYGHFWRTIVRPRILLRAGGQFNEKGKYLGGAKCERCGVPDRAIGYRNQSGRFVELGEKGGRSAKLQGYKVITIVLTVCHKNHQSRDNRDENLSALCQKDHLRHDRAQHKLTRQTRKDLMRPLLLDSFQVTLFEALNTGIAGGANTQEPGGL